MSTEPIISPRFQKPLAIGGLVVLIALGWWYYVRTVSFDATNHTNWVKGTLSIQGSLATARLHNSRDGWAVEEVVLFVWSGKGKPCKKNSPGCGPDEVLRSLPVDDATEHGRYLCVPKARAAPSETFECSFTYPYTVGWGYSFGWAVSDISARRVNPLGL